MMMTGIQIFQPWYRFYPIYRLSKYYKIVEKSKKESEAYVRQVSVCRLEQIHQI